MTEQLTQQRLPEETPILSLSIVHHDGREMLHDCLQSLFAAPPRRSFEVVLVDNVSTDGAVDMVRKEFPAVRLLCNTHRQGYGDNQNKGMEACRGRYILQLNDDTIVHPGALDTLCEFLDTHPQTAAVGPRLLNVDGSLQLSCYRFPTPLRCIWENILLTALMPNQPFIGDYRAWLHDSVRHVDFLHGAAILVRREVIEKIGVFDTETFFMYAEETDWQTRMHKEGWDVTFCPDATITHIGGQSSERMRDRQFCEFNRSQVRYIIKHHGRAGAAVQRVMMVVGGLLRVPLWTAIYMVSPRWRNEARIKIHNWLYLLRWWSGFGPHEGIAEMAQAKMTSPDQPQKKG